MSNVYVPQVPSRFDTQIRRWVPTVSLNSARRFGTVIECLPPEASRLATAPMVDALKEKMKDFNKDDALIFVGDPSLIAAAAGIAMAKTGGRLRLLKWDRETSDYILVELAI